MPILNWKEYGLNILKFNPDWNFTEQDVIDQLLIDRELLEKHGRKAPEKNMTGAEFLEFCRRYEAKSE